MALVPRLGNAPSPPALANPVPPAADGASLAVRGGIDSGRVPPAATRAVPDDSAPAHCSFCGAVSVTRSLRLSSAPWDLWTCGRCANSFVFPVPSPEQLAPYYTFEGYGAPGYLRDSPHNRAAVRRMGDLLVELEHLLGGPGRILDVGCSIGNMLLAARDRGWAVEGIEIDPETAAVARDRSGAFVHVGSGLEVLPSDVRFDLVSMNHWLEHTRDPGRQFELAASHLRIGGIAAVRVPNAASSAARLLGTSWNWYQPPVHLQYFAPQSFRVKARDTGLTVLRLEARQGDATPLPIELVTGSIYRWWARHARPARSLAGLTPVPPSEARGRLRTQLELVSDALTRVNPFRRWEDSEILCVLRREPDAPPH